MLPVLPGLGDTGVSAVGKAPRASPVGRGFSRVIITESVWLEGGRERQGLGGRGVVGWGGAAGQKRGWRLEVLWLTQHWLWAWFPCTNHTGVPTGDKMGQSFSAKPLLLRFVLSPVPKTVRWMLWELTKPTLPGAVLPTELRKGEVLLGHAGCCYVT